MSITGPRDLYADGHSDGYNAALVDVASESDRITSPGTARALIKRLRYQYLEQVGQVM